MATVHCSFISLAKGNGLQLYYYVNKTPGFWVEAAAAAEWFMLSNGRWMVVYHDGAAQKLLSSASVVADARSRTAANFYFDHIWYKNIKERQRALPNFIRAASEE